MLVGFLTSQQGSTALIVAGFDGGLDILCLLLDRGADVEAKDGVSQPGAAGADQRLLSFGEETSVLRRIVLRAGGWGRIHEKLRCVVSQSR